MSEAIILNAIVRKDVGKGASRRLRLAEKVPAIIYGGEVEPAQITLESKAVRKALESETFYSQIITLEVDGASQQVILKDIQRHPAKEYAMHMDFLRVDAAHAVTTHIPLHFLNEDVCVGVKAGGAITHARVEVEVKCLPADLPEFIEVDMANVELGGHLHLTDLSMPKGVELVALLQGEGHDLDVVSVQTIRGGNEEDESEEASEEAGEE